jgi:hypothetical protein
MDLSFIPQPQRIRRGKGVFAVVRKGAIGISGQQLYPVAEQARRLFRGFAIAVGTGATHDPISISLRGQAKPGGYRLAIGPKGIRLEADSVAAAFHGVGTLEQVVRQSKPGVLPALTIDDWPDFADRGVYYDVCRGRVPKRERLLEQADLLSRFKINHLQLYIEHTFRFRGHPEIGRGASPLTAEDILELDRFCADRHIELVPSLATFGHMATVLKHKQYHHLAEDWGVGEYVSPEAERLRHKRYGWTLSPANPGVYDFLDSLFAEFLPLFRSDQFNVCCDETWDLGMGQSYALCRRRGKGRVYLDHIVKLNRLCRKYGKRLMFWGDIIRHYPELIRHIPKDVTVLDWAYTYDHDFDSIRDFKKAGLRYMACPSVSGYSSLFPRLPEAAANIHGFAQAGKKNGASGLLNTDWGDGGHYNFMEYSWHGYLFGAEQSWNTRADRKTFTARFCKIFLNDDSPALARAIDELGDIAYLQVNPFYQSIWQHIFFAKPQDAVLADLNSPGHISRGGRIRACKVRLDARCGRETLKRLQPVRKAIADSAARRGADPHKVLPYWLFAVDTLAHAAGKLAVFGAGGRVTPAKRRVLRKEMTSLMKRFEKLWLQRSRRSEIGITLRRYRAAIGALR